MCRNPCRERCVNCVGLYRLVPVNLDRVAKCEYKNNFMWWYFVNKSQVVIADHSGSPKTIYDKNNRLGQLLCKQRKSFSPVFRFLSKLVTYSNYPASIFPSPLL